LVNLLFSFFACAFILKILADFPNALLSESRGILAARGISYGRRGLAVLFRVFGKPDNFVALEICDPPPPTICFQNL